MGMRPRSYPCKGKNSTHALRKEKTQRGEKPKAKAHTISLLNSNDNSNRMSMAQNPIKVKLLNAVLGVVTCMWGEIIR